MTSLLCAVTKFFYLLLFLYFLTLISLTAALQFLLILATLVQASEMIVNIYMDILFITWL